jgi:serine/threonine protein kinase
VSGLSPFAGECDVETMGNVTVGKYDFNDEAFDNVSSECIDFITKLLVKGQDDRMTASQALRHRWVKKKPQYTPTAKPLNPLSFKASYLDKVSRRVSFDASPFN